MDQVDSLIAMADGATGGCEVEIAINGIVEKLAECTDSCMDGGLVGGCMGEYSETTCHILCLDDMLSQ
jgi:hypothetical protein